MSATILTISGILQYAAAILALRLAALTGRRLGWFLVASAMLLMAVRRTITLYRIASHDFALQPDLAAESVALVISVLMLVGVARISPIFTELKRKTAEISKKQSQLQAIMDNTSAAVFVKDLDGKYLLANDQAWRAVGNGRDDIIGKTDFDLFPEDQARLIRENDERVLSEAKNYEFDETLSHDDGSDHHYFSIKFPLLDERGKPYALCGISTDVTDRVSIEEERRQFESRVQHAQKLESLGVLAGGIAHDFNNLLVGVLGSAELILSRDELSREARDDLGTIKSASETAATLCRQLLAYSGRGKFQVTAIDLNEVVQEMIRLLEVSISKKARLEVHLAEDLPLIEGDRAQVVQVIMNLITNASDAIGDDSGTITLMTTAVDIGPDGLENDYSEEPIAPGRYACVSVEDTGVGMNDETKRRLFEPFFTTKFTGRGLGLAATAGILRGHGGAIALETAPEIGTTFRVLFPVPAEPPTVQTPPPARDVPGSAATILVVDDEVVIRKFAEKVLSRAGFDVVTASNGRQAMKIYDEKSAAIALVLMDLMMPEMDGEQTMLELKRMDPDVRILLASGYDESSMSGERRGDAVCGFLQKPFTAQLLVESVHQALDWNPLAKVGLSGPESASDT